MAAAALITRTVDDLTEEMLRDSRVILPGYDTRQNGEAWATAKIFANVLSGVYANGGFLAKQAFPQTSNDTYLAIHAQTDNVSRLGAQFGSGSGTVSASVAQTIADQAPATNQSTGQKYKIVGATSITSPTFTAAVYIVAATAGDAANCAAGTVLTLDNPPAGVNPQIVTQRISGGDIAWTTQRWAREILRVRRARPGCANTPQVEMIGDLVGGVEKCFPYPALRGAGTMDVVITTSAATGGRVASSTTVADVLGALESGMVIDAANVVPGLPDDVLENTNVMAARAQPTDMQVVLRASYQNPYGAWPPPAVTTDPDTWYFVAPTPSVLTTFTVATPLSGAPVAPPIGADIGVFFPSVGYCKGTILNVSGSVGGPWAITVARWVASDGNAPTDVVAAFANAMIVPWCSQLYVVAGAPDMESGSLALTGAVPDFFAGLGPGEMTALTPDDVFRRRRYPATTSTDPATGIPTLTTDVTGRLTSAILDDTDCVDCQTATLAIVSPLTSSTVDATLATPVVPDASIIGAPPSILTLRSIYVVAVR